MVKSIQPQGTEATNSPKHGFADIDWYAMMPRNQCAIDPKGEIHIKQCKEENAILEPFSFMTNNRFPHYSGYVCMLK